jgi:hypothetical protein
MDYLVIKPRIYVLVIFDRHFDIWYGLKFKI